MEQVKASNEICQIDLPVSEKALSPTLSKNAIYLHYSVLYKHYVDNALSTGDEFQIAGAKLHTTFFEQLQKSTKNNKPHGNILELINDNFNNFNDFKSKFLEEGSTIHGSGWVYLSTSGKIKTISNHKVVKDIAVLIDLWEHSYILDYESDKTTYLKNIWDIINWDIVNGRLE